MLFFAMENKTRPNTVLTSGKNSQAVLWLAANMPGPSVACLEDDLSVGPLRDRIDSRLPFMPGGKKIQKILHVTKGLLREAQTVTLYADGSPAALCSLYAALHILRHTPLKLSVCMLSTGSLPGAMPPVVMEKGGDGFVTPSAEQLDMMAMHWRKLVRENSLLRLVRDGIPVSTREDFFDGLLLAGLESGARQEDILLRARSEIQDGYGYHINHDYLRWRLGLLRK